MHPSQGVESRVLGKLGRYRLYDELDGGPMTRMFVAADGQGARLWLKALMPELAEVGKIRSHFVQSHRIMQRLHHPHTVPVVDVVNHQNTPYVVLQLMSGGTAVHALERSGAMHPITATQIGLQLSSALGAVHGVRLTHLAVQPANIFIGVGGAPRLGSPGLHGYADAHLLPDLAPVLLGYAAPELLNGEEEPDPRADIFALGATIYSLVTGHILDAPGSAVADRLDLSPVPEALREVIAQCCASQSSARFGSIAQVESALRYAVRALAEVYGPEQLPGPSLPSRPPQSHATPPPTSPPVPVATPVPEASPIPPAPPTFAPPAPAPPPSHTPSPPLAAGLGAPLASIGDLPTRIHGVNDDVLGPTPPPPPPPPEHPRPAPSPAAAPTRRPSQVAMRPSSPSLHPSHGASGHGQSRSVDVIVRPGPMPSNVRRRRNGSRLVAPPGALVAASALLLTVVSAFALLLAGSTMLMRSAEHDVEVTRQHLYLAMGAEDARVADWITSEFQDGELMARYTTWHETLDEPARIEHALTFIDDAEKRSTTLARHLSAQRYRHTERVLGELLEARAEHEQAVWLWHARGGSALGRIAIRLGTSSEPH